MVRFGDRESRVLKGGSYWGGYMSALEVVII